MHRLRAALFALASAGLLALGTSVAGAAGPPFPEPVVDQAVYDETGLLQPGVVAALEEMIDAIEARSGAEIAVYLQVHPGLGANEDANRDAARDLMRQWGVGRAGFDDGLVILVSFQDNRINGQVATWGGDGFLAAYLSEGDLSALRDNVMVPAFRQQEVGGGLLAALQVVDASITPADTAALEAHRIINAIVGIPGSILALLVTLGTAYVAWRRDGDDPELTDSPSILMAGPPAEMTPALATVLRQGRATQHSINTTLLELASSERIAFRNLDRVKEVKADDDPDPLTDPAIDVLPEPAGARGLAKPQQHAWEVIQGKAAGTGVLARKRLWSLNDALDPVKRGLDREAVSLGWLTRLPWPAMRRWLTIGALEAVVGGGLIFLGFVIPMSGLTLLGGALIIGGLGSAAFGMAMSKRTAQGAYVDAMLTAYRRTLRKTMEQARNMNEVVSDPVVRALADTPDKAVVWGIALGLHHEVSEVLRRGLADPTVAEGTTHAYYPVWLGASDGTGGHGAAAGAAGGSLFSGSGIPDVGGMFSALGSVGSSPASSSSSSGGGFSGGGGGGGGGGSSGF
jgi:uncharacterized membrane protein YgcG